MGNENNNKPSRPLSSFLPPVSSPKKEIGMIMSVSYNILNFLTSVGYQSCFYEKFCSDLKDSNITTLINGNEKTQFRDLNSMILSETKRNFEKKEDFFPDPIKLLNYSIYNGLNIFNLLDKNLPEKKELTLLNSKTLTGYYSALKSKISNSNGPISLNFIEKQFIDSSHESKYFDIQLQHILETLENKSENIKEKYIIIISDGSLIKVSEKLNNLVREAKRNNIPIITLLLTKHKNRVKKLYNEFPNHLNEDIKNLFDITSKVKYNDVFGNYFIKKGWSFPEDGQGTLLFETDYSDLKNDSFAEDLNQISFNGIDIKLRQMSYNNLIHFKYNFIPKNQIFGTCWAYAYAAAIFLTNKTILGRKTISFENIRENLIKYASEKNSDGGNIENPSVINYFHSKKIYFRNVNEQVAKDALMKGSFVVCHFWLNNIQWENFSYYFYREKTKTKILNEDDLNKGCKGNVNPPKPDEAHAVLLIEIGPGFLRFLDSSGPDMGDKGTFKVKNADVLTSYTTNKKAEFFEIFVDEKDITKEEKQYYKNNIDYIKELLSYYEDLSAKKIINAVKPLYELKYKCENCQNKLKIKQSLITIDNGFDKIKCSTCKFLNYRKDFLKKLLIMNNLLNDGNDDFNINFKENYYVDIDRIQLYEEFEEKNKFINESNSCSLGYIKYNSSKNRFPLHY